jgi:hypothetical protein
MGLKPFTLDKLSEMVCGNQESKLGRPFPYRSSSSLNRFFRDCDVEAVHRGETRNTWVYGVLTDLNKRTSEQKDLPSDEMVRVIVNLVDADYFNGDVDLRGEALRVLNSALAREDLQVALNTAGEAVLRSVRSGVVVKPLESRPLTQEEEAKRSQLSDYLDKASEDDFTEKVLVPYFKRRGFRRIELAGHREKILEFGKDLWMKFQLPTGHWLYFCAQVKRGTIDAKGVSRAGTLNVSEVHQQAQMAIDHPIFDPELNQKVLLDHLFIISAGRITKQAKEWLGTKLHASQRRHMIFMDRGELLDDAARVLSDLRLPVPKDDVPF